MEKLEKMIAAERDADKKEKKASDLPSDDDPDLPFDFIGYASFWRLVKRRRVNDEVRGLLVKFSMHPRRCPQCKHRKEALQEKAKLDRKIGKLEALPTMSTDQRTQLTNLRHSHDEVMGRLSWLELHEFARIHQRPWINRNVRDALQPDEVMVVMDYTKVYDTNNGRVNDLVLVLHTPTAGLVAFAIPTDPHVFGQTLVTTQRLSSTTRLLGRRDGRRQVESSTAYSSTIGKSSFRAART